MKKMHALLFTALFLMPLAPKALAQFKNLDLKVTKRVLDRERERDYNKSSRTKDIAYEVTIKNLRFDPSPELEVRYRVFYEVEQQGLATEPKLKSVQGMEKVASIDAMKSESFQTKPISLTETQLDADWYYTTGAKNKSKDRVAGYWFRIYNSDGELETEYLNPSTLSKRVAWED